VSLAIANFFAGDKKVFSITITSSIAITLTRAYFSAKSERYASLPEIVINTTDDPTQIAITNNGTITPIVTITLESTVTESLPTRKFNCELRILLNDGTIKTFDGYFTVYPVISTI
jgi:hypothetical protein